VLLFYTRKESSSAVTQQGGNIVKELLGLA